MKPTLTNIQGSALNNPIDITQKVMDPSPQMQNMMNPNANSETLKTFYTNLISNTPNSNTRPGASANMKSAFDVII